MTDQLRAEQARLQALFNQANQHGATVELADPPPDDLLMDLGMAVQFTVTRVAPRLVDGKPRSDFWLRWKARGYEQGEQFTHTIKVIREALVRPDGLLLVDDRDRTFVVTVPAPAEEWARWQEHATTHAADLAYADAILDPFHQHLAEQWKGR